MTDAGVFGVFGLGGQGVGFEIRAHLSAISR